MPMIMARFSSASGQTFIFGVGVLLIGKLFLKRTTKPKQLWSKPT